MNDMYNDHMDLVFETYLNQRDKHTQVPTCDKTSDNPPFTQIDDFQITTFEIENENLNEVVENMVIELDFNSFEGMEPNLKFDLPFLDFEI